MNLISGVLLAAILFTGIVNCSSIPRRNFSRSDDYDLIDLTQIYSINTLASKVLFIYKYDEFTFHVRHDIFQSEPYYEKKNIIKLYNIDFALKLFEMFGNLITNLKIDYETLPTKKINVINEQITKYCLNSLNHLEIGYIVGDELISLKGTFSKAENVSIVNQSNESEIGILNTNGMNLKEMFPKVRRFSFEVVSFTDPKCFEHNFPHLEHLNLNLREKNHEHIERIIKLNPQLKSISLNGASWNLLKKINQHIPTLISLKFTNLDSTKYEGEDIHFQNLKYFEFDDYTKSVVKSHISFGSLEEFDCYYSFDKFYDAFIQNKHLKKIRIGGINNEQLLEIAEKLTNLEEMFTFYDTNGSTEEVIQFLQKAHNLQLIAFAQIDPITQTAIEEQLGNEWKIVTENSRFGRFSVILRKKSLNIYY